MKHVSIAILFVLLSPCALAQDVYGEFTATLHELQRSENTARLNEIWNELVSAGKIPLVAGDSIAFLYRGEAKNVSWMGDFNGWGSGKTFNNRGDRIPGTDLWLLKAALPGDARLDYKVLINGQHLIIDPFNPHYQWSGVGGGSLNSELRMPQWRQDPLTTGTVEEAPRGSIQKDRLFTSRELGYQVTFSVYLPPGYHQDRVYPVLYVTDGYEYLHERLGNMATVIDNLVYLQKIEPLVAVFIDHREPANRSLNRRMQELAVNEKYLSFLVRELLPDIEEKFSVSREASERAIVGTSLGGLSATWMCFSQPQYFGRLGVQSPAFWFKPEIYKLVETSQSHPDRIFLSTGLIYDAEEGVRKMRGILDRKEYPYQFKAVNQGQSWGNWRDLIDDMLVYLFPSGD